MDTFLLILLVFAIGPIIVIGIIIGILAMGDKGHKSTKEYRPYKETPDEVLISGYKRCLKEIAKLGTQHISSWIEQQTVQSQVNRLESSLTMYSDELTARGYKIDYSNTQNVRIWKQVKK